MHAFSIAHDAMLARILRPLCGTSGPRAPSPSALRYLARASDFIVSPDFYRNPMRYNSFSLYHPNERKSTTHPKKPSTDFEPAAQTKLFDFFRQLASETQERGSEKIEVPGFDPRFPYDARDSDPAVEEEIVRHRHHERQQRDSSGTDSLAPRPEPRFGIDVKEDTLSLFLDNVERLADTSSDKIKAGFGDPAVSSLRGSTDTSNERSRIKDKVRNPASSSVRSSDMKTTVSGSGHVGFADGIRKEQRQRKLALPDTVSSFVPKANRQNRGASHDSVESVPEGRVSPNPTGEESGTRQLPNEVTPRKVLLSDTRFWQRTGRQLAEEQRVSSKSWRLASERLLPPERKLYRAWKKQIYNPMHGIKDSDVPAPDGDKRIKIDLPTFNWDEYVAPVKRTSRSIRRHNNRAAAMNVVFQHNEAIPENASWLWKHMPYLKPLIRVMIKVMQLERQIRRDMRNQPTWLPIPSEVVPFHKRRDGKRSFSRRTLRR
ncbi:hypothetical protein BDW66DRAFT_123943 [Aspergillus desertorum]